MKRLILTHLFLNLYLLAIVQPIYPILDYLVNYDYIVEQLCENRNKPILACNGKCYLEKQVSGNRLNNSTDQKVLPPEIDFDKLRTVRPLIFTYQLTECLISTTDHEFRILRTTSKIATPLLRPPIS